MVGEDDRESLLGLDDHVLENQLLQLIWQRSRSNHRVQVCVYRSPVALAVPQFIDDVFTVYQEGHHQNDGDQENQDPVGWRRTP